MIVTHENINSLIPQRPPFVMIDTLIYSDENLTRTGFQVRADNVLVRNGELQEPGLVETIAQTAAARAGYIAQKENMPVSIGYIGSISNLEIFSLPKINEELETEITVVNQIFNVTLISGKVSCKGTVLAQCDMKIFITQIK